MALVAPHLFKYFGVALFLEERIFLIDFEELQKNEMTVNLDAELSERVEISLRPGERTLQPPRTESHLRTRRPRLSRTRADQETAHEGRTALLPSDASIPVEVRSHLGEPGAVVIRGGAS